MNSVVLPADVARHFAVHAINTLLEADEGCCPICCGPCFGLAKLIEEDKLDEVVKPPDDVSAYSWQDETTGKVDVEQLKDAWNRGKELLACEDMHEDLQDATGDSI